MKRLSEYAKNRDNNFNLIRFVAATLVLITHSFALSLGSADAEPLRSYLGTTWGAIAVDVFFITSGFLITSSFFARNNIIIFVWARVLRIYPALIVAGIFSVFVVGVFFTTHSIFDYLSDAQTYKFFIKNIILIFNLEWTLPGVFENNPYKGAVNGSLWTLPYEVKMYACLAIIASILVYLNGFLEKANVIKVVFVCIAIIAIGVDIVNHFQHFVIAKKTVKFIHLFAMFFVGSAFYVCRDHVLLTCRAFFFGVVLLLLSSMDKNVFFIVYTVFLAYLIFYLAYVPEGKIRKFNKLGDYSYGIYIYAFPVQQSLAALMPGITVGVMVISSFFITAIMAFVSWHMIEKKSLRLKRS